MELGIRKAENKKLRAERKEKVKDRGLEAGKEDKRIRRCGPATVRGLRLEVGGWRQGLRPMEERFSLRSSSYDPTSRLRLEAKAMDEGRSLRPDDGR